MSGEEKTKILLAIADGLGCHLSYGVSNHRSFTISRYNKKHLDYCTVNLTDGVLELVGRRSVTLTLSDPESLTKVSELMDDHNFTYRASVEQELKILVRELKDWRLPLANPNRD